MAGKRSLNFRVLNVASFCFPSVNPQRDIKMRAKIDLCYIHIQQLDKLDHYADSSYFGLFCRFVEVTNIFKTLRASLFTSH